MKAKTKTTPGNAGIHSKDEGQAVPSGLPGQAAELVSYLARRIGVPFRGRLLEIGAGVAWLSADLSKLPGVVEIIAVESFAARAKVEAPRVPTRLGGIESKITRVSGAGHELDYPDNHFDFVVCAELLNRTANIVTMLREVRRVLKPGGHFVAVREPVIPRLKIRSPGSPQDRTRDGRLLYSLDEYKRFFAAASLSAEIKRVNLASGMKYYFDQVFNGLTHARYAFVARKPVRPSARGTY
jgi:SAM-dependent methyltransferase